MVPGKTFQQSHLAGDAERERNSIARQTVRWKVAILALFGVGVAVGWMIFG